MSSRGSRNPLSMVLMWAVLIVGVIIGCCLVLGGMIGVGVLVGH